MCFNEADDTSDVHARFVCALVALNCLEPYRPGPRATQAQAFACAIRKDLDYAQVHYHHVLRLSHVQALLQAAQAVAATATDKIESTAVSRLPQSFTPPRQLAAHLNRPARPAKTTTTGRIEKARPAQTQTPVFHERHRSDQADYLNSSFYTLCSELLTHPLLDYYPHFEMGGWFDLAVEHRRRGMDRQLKIAISVPREGLKSSLGLRFILRWLDLFPDDATLINTHTHGFSRELLAEQKDIMERDAAFREHFGDWVTDAGLWNQNAVKVNFRRTARKEPSIDTAGVDKPKTGGHYNFVWNDDLHTEKNVYSERWRQRVKRFIRIQSPIVAQGGVNILTYTRWHHADAYGEIIRQEHKRREDKGIPLDLESRVPVHELLDYVARGDIEWVIFKRRWRNEDGTLFFPKHLTEKFIAQKRIDLADKEFACFYENVIFQVRCAHGSSTSCAPTGRPCSPSSPSAATACGLTSSGRLWRSTA
jgi:hypothetical protein